MQSRLRQTQPPRSTAYFNALLQTGHYDPTLQSTDAHHKRQRARAIVANNHSLTLDIRQEALHDLQLHGQRTFTYSVSTLARFTEPQSEPQSSIPNSTIKRVNNNPQYLTRFLELKRRYRRIQGVHKLLDYGCDHNLVCFCNQ